MILFSDLHLKPESAETCFEVLDAVLQLACASDRCVAFLGDFWHVRYALPVDLLNRVSDELERWLAEDVDIHLLPGNHDQIDVHGQHALEVLERPGVAVYTQPTENELGLWLPYRKDIATLLAAVESSTAKRAFVHHGLIGAQMNSGVVAGAADGVPPAAFQKFQNAFFGHWHRHQTIANCTYVGSPWQTSMGEAGQVKGVIDLDVATGAWKFVPLVLGKRFWKGDATKARKGDLVSLPADADRSLVGQLQNAGVDVIVEPPKVETTTRLGLGKGADLREYAARYVDAQAGELDKQRLMALFDEVTR